MKNIFFLLISLTSFISCDLSNKKTSDDYLDSGLSKAKEEDYRRAISDYDTAIILDPENSRAYFHRGNAEGNLDDFKKAIADYDSAIIHDSDDVNIYMVYSRRGEAKSTLGVLKSNIFDSDSYESLDSNEFKASFNAVMADSFDSKYYYLAAIVDYNKAIDLNATDADIYYYRGLTKGKLQDYRGAIQDYTKAIEINPKYSKAYYDRGISKIAIGQKDGGCLDLSKAGESGNAKAYETIKKNCN